jgi:hypothetical protein
MCWAEHNCRTGSLSGLDVSGQQEAVSEWGRQERGGDVGAARPAGSLGRMNLERRGWADEAGEPHRKCSNEDLEHGNGHADSDMTLWRGGASLEGTAGSGPAA